MSAPSAYVIRGGEEGRKRLEILARVMWPATYQLLKRAGTCAGMTVLDMGCGGGDVTRGIARLVGPEGRVVGCDMDGVKLDAARREAALQGLVNLEFRQANIYDFADESAYDRIYARFLLTHLPDCPGALARMRRALRPGGVLIVEDIDFTGRSAIRPTRRTRATSSYTAKWFAGGRAIRTSDPGCMACSPKQGCNR
ncbi:MAG TPA: class I SAM-dependent methyltransferase [Bryobacteraceae bacterium]